MHEGGDAEAPGALPKMTSEPPDFQNNIRAPRNRLRASRYVSEPPPFCLHAPILVSNKKYLAFTSTKNLFFEKSQHDKKV